MTGSRDIASVAESLRRFISGNLVAPGIFVGEETTFDALGLDSFSLIEIILFVEREFGCQLPDTALNKEVLYTPLSLATYICAHHLSSQ